METVRPRRRHPLAVIFSDQQLQSVWQDCSVINCIAHLQAQARRSEARVDLCLQLDLVLPPVRPQMSPAMHLAQARRQLLCPQTAPLTRRMALEQTPESRKDADLVHWGKPASRPSVPRANCLNPDRRSVCPYTGALIRPGTAMPVPLALPTCGNRELAAPASYCYLARRQLRAPVRRPPAADSAWALASPFSQDRAPPAPAPLSATIGSHTEHHTAARFLPGRSPFSARSAWHFPLPAQTCSKAHLAILIPPGRKNLDDHLAARS